MSISVRERASDARGAEETISIKVDYRVDSPDPARVFRAMSGLIDAIHLIDVHLARSINASVEPILLLQTIETGSIRSVMRQTVRIVDRSDVADDEVEPRIVRYLASGAVRILQFLDGHSTVDDPTEIRDLQRDLVTLATETGAAAFPSYEPIDTVSLLEDMQRVGEAANNLEEGDQALFASPEGDVQINRNFTLSSSQIEDLLTARTISRTVVRILVVKKPDYLGASKWQFRIVDHNIEAKMLDEKWLADFQARRIELRPGDAIRAEVSEEIKLDDQDNTVAEHYAILRVLEVIRADQYTQGDLLEEQ